MVESLKDSEEGPSGRDKLAYEVARLVRVIRWVLVVALVIFVARVLLRTMLASAVLGGFLGLILYDELPGWEAPSVLAELNLVVIGLPCVLGVVLGGLMIAMGRAAVLGFWIFATSMVGLFGAAVGLLFG